MMSCTVAISSSPVFSPSRVSVSSSLQYKAAAGSSSSPDTLSRIQSPSGTASSSSSPSSPLRILRLQKPPPSGLNRASSECSASTSPTVLKRKRPARLDIPIASMGFGNVPPTPVALESVVEFESDEFSVCCKRGRRGFPMEDRYSAKVNLHRDSKQVSSSLFQVSIFRFSSFLKL